MALLLLFGAAAPVVVFPARAESAADERGLLRDLLPTVVNITAKRVAGDPAQAVMAGSDQSAPQGIEKTLTGSGFIIDPDGTIVTNLHVVDGAYDIAVTFSDGSYADAHIMNATRLGDLALLKVDVGRKLPAVHWGDSETVDIGDHVVAVGNPLGIGQTVTSGIVSALNRDIMETPYDDFIQTDAAINHGNSGGPLFNMRGEVIGVNSAIVSPTSGSAGLGFSMPSNDARFIIDRFVRYGSVRPGWIGVKVQQVTREMAMALGMGRAQGSIVADVVRDGPAQTGGLQVGDVILRFGNRAPTDERALLREIVAAPVGEKIPITVLRNGKEQVVTPRIEEWPSSKWEALDAPTPAIRPRDVIPPDLGLMLAALTDETRAKYGLDLGQPGVLLTGVAANTDAARRGMAVGDVVLRVQDQPVASAAEVQQALDAARKAKQRYVMVLVLPKVQERPGPKWLVVQIAEE